MLSCFVEIREDGVELLGDRDGGGEGDGPDRGS